jgi:predicted DNA-binding WGR domain protein
MQVRITMMSASHPSRFWTAELLTDLFERHSLTVSYGMTGRSGRHRITYSEDPQALLVKLCRAIKRRHQSERRGRPPYRLVESSGCDGNEILAANLDPKATQPDQ